jgi:hypothetical protein
MFVKRSTSVFAWVLALVPWFAFASAALCHSLAVERVTLVETAPRHYAIQYVAPVIGPERERLPVLPPEAVWAAGTELAPGPVTLRFSLPGRELRAGDKIVFPWSRNGVMVFVRWADGQVARQFFGNSANGIVVEMSQLRAGSGGLLPLAGRYLALGAAHLWKGADHLLFVIGILFLVRGVGRMLRTITAFTLAHSITLALATLDALRLPQAPVEAIVALSLMFLAVEALRAERGESSVTLRHPWVMAFAFGLVHGLGFAGALSELGLPGSEIPGALLFFNLGIEAGQLAVVAVWLPCAWAAARLRLSVPRRLKQVPAYALGTVSALWLLDRLLQMVVTQSPALLP